MGMDSSMVQLDSVLNVENMEIIWRYHQELNDKQRELQNQYGIKDVQINVLKINLQ
jgi:hypothetical protein